MQDHDTHARRGFLKAAGATGLVGLGCSALKASA